MRGGKHGPAMEGKPEYMDNILNNWDGATSVIGKITIWSSKRSRIYDWRNNCIANGIGNDDEAQKGIHMSRKHLCGPMFSQGK